MSPSCFIDEDQRSDLDIWFSIFMISSSCDYPSESSVLLLVLMDSHLKFFSNFFCEDRCLLLSWQTREKQEGTLIYMLTAFTAIKIERFLLNNLLFFFSFILALII